MLDFLNLKTKAVRSNHKIQNATDITKLRQTKPQKIA